MSKDILEQEMTEKEFLDKELAKLLERTLSLEDEINFMEF